MAGLTETIGKFVIQTNLDDVPSKVITLAKNAIIDCIGSIIAGSREDASLIIQKYVQDLGGVPNAFIIGTRIRTTGPFAALANGVAGHVLDLDDINSLLIGHPSVVLIPALLAAGELAHADGKGIVLGYILGFEIMVKLAGLINPDHYEHGWHATSTFGPLGASVGAAKVFGLNQEQTQRAMGLATSLAGGVRSNFGTMTKPFHAGNAARSGLESSLLCNMGFTANAGILDHSMGFLDVFGKFSENARNKLSDSLGNPYELISSGIDFKRYPCCGGVLAAADAAMAIRKNPEFSINKIESILCGENELGPKMVIYSRPKTPLEAKFSIEYGVCRILLDGQLGLEQFTEEKVHEPILQELLRKTQSFVHPELRDVKLSEKDRAQRFPAIITVRLKDGTELTERVDNAKGRWDNPLTQEELYDKYRIYAGLYLSKNTVERSLELLDQLENLKDISELMAELTLYPS
jgi:2-methylcitrate dehydratase PrpD